MMDEPLEFFHFRDRYGSEVDIVIDDQDGRVPTIDVKASATVTARDFAGLNKLAEVCGKRFITGFTLYDHDIVLPFGKQRYAMPISSLL